MPIATELTIRIDNRPGSLGIICRDLANHGVNIMAFQSVPSVKTILVCIVVDKPAAAEAVLDLEGITYTEAEVAQVQLPQAPGELARAVSKLGDANIDIKYAYCGVELTIRNFWNSGKGIRPRRGHFGSQRRCA